MSELPMNEPNDEKEPVTGEGVEHEEQEMVQETAVSPPDPEPEPINEPEKRPSRRRLVVGGMVLLLLVVVAAGVAFLMSTQNKEQAQLQQAQTAAREGAWSLAEQSLDTQLALQPVLALRHVAEAHGLRGIARYEQGDIEGALADLNEALAQDANLMDLYAYRALVLADSDHEAALADAETAVNSGLLSDYLAAQVQAALGGDGSVAASADLDYLTDAQVVDLTLTQTAQLAESEEWAQVVDVTTAVLGREYELQPEQTARLAYAVAMAHQSMGDDAAAFAQADKALAQDAGLTDAEQAALYLLRAVWYEAHGELETAVTEAEAAAALDDTITLHLALQAWLAYREFDMETAVANAETVLETAEAGSLAAQIAQRTLGGVDALQDNPRPAPDALDAALAINPDDVEARALRVQSLLNVSEWEAAEDDAAYLAEIAPTAPASLWAQAHMAMSDGDLELANVLLNQAIAQDATHPEYYWLRAESYRITLDKDKSAGDLAAALALYPEFLLALESQQYLLLDKYTHEQLEETAHQLIELYPESPSGYQLLGIYYLDVVGDKEEALRQAEEVIARNPDNGRGYVAQASIHLLMNELEAAQEDYEQVLALDSHSAAGRDGLSAIALQQGDVETAVALAEEVVEMYPRSLQARNTLASTYMDQDELEKAWELVHQVLAEDPRHSQAMILRAYLLVYQDEFGQALGEIEKLISLNPDNPYAYATKASFLLQLGRLDEAVESAERALALNPLLADPHRPLFFAAIENNDPDEANTQLDLWLEKASIYDENSGLLSYMQLVSGRFEDVIVTTTDALAEDPDVDTYYFNRALAHLNQAQVEEGQADLEQVLAISDNIDLIAEAEEVLAESKQIVSTGDGRFQYTNETFGYTLNYAGLWEKGVGDSGQMDLMLMYETDDDFGAAYTNLFIEEVDVTAEMIADIVINDSSRRSDFTLISSDPTPLNQGNSYVIRYELDTDELYQGKQYIFTQGNRIVLLTLEAGDSIFAELEEELDAIAASFAFLP